MMGARRSTSYPAGGGVQRWYMPAWDTVPDSDPNAIANGVAVIDGPGRIRFNAQNPGIVSYTPGTGARWEVPLIDISGGSHDDIVLGDVLRSLARAAAHVPDLVIWAGIRNSANGHGFAGGLVSSGTAWEAARSHNVGSGWTAPTDATGTPSALTVGVVGCADLGTSSTQGSIMAFPIDAAGLPIAGTSLPTARQAAAGMQGPFDTFFVEFGWRTGVGGSPGEVSAGGSFLVVDRNDLAWDPFG